MKNKICADMLFLLLADVKRRIVVVTNKILFRILNRNAATGAPGKNPISACAVAARFAGGGEKSSKEQRKTQ